MRRRIFYWYTLLTIGIRFPYFAEHFNWQSQGSFIALKWESLVHPGLTEIAVHDVTLNNNCQTTSQKIISHLIKLNLQVGRGRRLGPICYLPGRLGLTMSISDIGPIDLTCMFTSISSEGPGEKCLVQPQDINHVCSPAKSGLRLLS